MFIRFFYIYINLFVFISILISVNLFYFSFHLFYLISVSEMSFFFFLAIPTLSHNSPFILCLFENHQNNAQPQKLSEKGHGERLKPSILEDLALIWQPSCPDLSPLPPLLMVLTSVREIPHMFVESGTAVWKWMDSVKAMYQERTSQVLVGRNEHRALWVSLCGWGCSIMLYSHVSCIVFLHSFSIIVLLFKLKAKVSFCPWFCVSMCVETCFSRNTGRWG